MILVRNSGDGSKKPSVAADFLQIFIIFVKIPRSREVFLKLEFDLPHYLSRTRKTSVPVLLFGL